MPFYSDSTEKEIAELTIRISKEIREKSKISFIEELLKELKERVHYLLWE